MRDRVKTNSCYMFLKYNLLNQKYPCNGFEFPGPGLEGKELLGLLRTQKLPLPVKYPQKQHHGDGREEGQEPQAFDHGPVGTAGGGHTAAAVDGSCCCAPVEKGNRGGRPHHGQDGDPVVPRARPEAKVGVHNEAERLEAVC